MRHRFKLSPALVCSALLLVLILGASQVCAQVSITSPKNGATVFGVVTVQATKADPGDGWIAFRVTPADEKFLVAVTAPFTFEWNTALRDARAQATYPDGEYTLEAAAYDGSGKQQGTAKVTVRIKNTIEATAFGEKVLLRANYDRADIFLYEMEGNQVVDVPDPAGNKLRNPPEMTMGGAPGMGGMGMAPPPPMMGGMGMGMGMGQNTLGVPSTVRIRSDAAWTLEVLTPSATGRAIVDQDLLRGYFLCTWVWPKKMNEKTMKMDRNVPDKFSGWLPGNKTEPPTEGRYYRSKVMANGEFIELHKSDPDFPMGQFYLQLPEDPVAPGATWRGSMAMITGLTDSENKSVPASFRLEGFEYRGRYRCARISATHTETGVEIPWDLPGAPAGAGAGGMPGGAPGPGGGAMMGGLMGMMGGMTGGMGGMMGGMGGMGMVGPDGEPAGTLKGDVSIKRVAYFALDEGRFVAFEDTINKKVTRILLPDPMEMGMMGGMGGGMMGGGMGMEMKPLEYRGLNHWDATDLMGRLVGAGGAMGMGGMGGMMGGMMGGPGGMMGGMPPPPMPGGMPGMMPPGGGMPGMGGPGGGMMMDPPVPAVINIDTTLKVEEVRQLAGHALAGRSGL